MATAEGVFPKIGNDPIYASEINRYATAGQLWATGSTDFVGSQTARQVLGSVVFNAGSLSNPAFIEMQLRYTMEQSASTLYIGASGISSFKEIGVGSAYASAGMLNAKIFAGSPMKGMITCTNMFNANNFINLQSAGNGYLDNLNTSNETVILFSTKAAGSMNIDSYYIQAYGGI